MDNGMQKSVKESYLVDAFTFTDAEASVIEELSSRGEGALTIADIRRVKIAEMFVGGTGDKFYKGKIIYITLDEKSGKEKKSALFVIVRAFDVEGALKILLQAYTDSAFEIFSVTETPIMDVLMFSNNDDKDNGNNDPTDENQE
jgi:hypothetical protein